LRRLLPWLSALTLVALIVAGLWPKPVVVEIARVTTGPLRVTINEEGKTRIKQRYLVAAPVAGYLRRIPWKAGAEVTLNETLLAAAICALSAVGCGSPGGGGTGVPGSPRTTTLVTLSVTGTPLAS